MQLLLQLLNIPFLPLLLGAHCGEEAGALENKGSVVRVVSPISLSTTS